MSVIPQHNAGHGQIVFLQKHTTQKTLICINTFYFKSWCIYKSSALITESGLVSLV